MKIYFITLITILYSFTVASAQDSVSIKMLERKVQDLEERLSRMERTAALTPEAKKMMQIARKHVESENKKFNSSDISKAENLYARASQLLREHENDSKKLLDSVVSLYPQLNRSGCAQLYRAEQEKGHDEERLLKDCIDRFSSCYYLDGAQVGPLAMLYLAMWYKEKGMDHESRKLFKQIRHQYPDAVDHNGYLLVNEFE